MIQYYLDLENQVKKITDAHLSYGQIQKIYSTSFFVSLAIRTPGKTWHLFLGRGGGYEGIWLHESGPPSVLRRKDNFLEYLRRHLSSCALVDVSLDEGDRIVKIAYQKFGQLHSFLLFWKARKLYFVHHYQDIPEGPFKLLLSWKGKAVSTNGAEGDLFEYFNEVGRRDEMSHDLKSPHPVVIEDLIQEELKALELKGFSSSPTFLQRKKDNIQEDLRKARQWERLQSMLDKEDNLEGIYELKVDDQKIKFEGLLNSYERRNLVFQKIKKLKRGEGILSMRLDQVTEQLQGNTKTENKTSLLPIIKPIWGKDEGKSTVHLSSPANKEEYRVFKLDEEEIQVGVGLTSQGNDQLRSKWANKDDHWLHLDGLKSAHVIIKTASPTLSPAQLDLGASILAHFSHFNDDWIPIIFTQVKNLKGVTGAPGMVIFKKEKHLRCSRLSLDHVLKEN